jgi:ABC-type transport system involved in multi-copper enzyme maturation permease subunit
MSPLVETRLVLLRELRRNLQGSRGVLLLLLSIAGGTLTAFALLAFAKSQIAQAAKAGITAESVDMARAGILQFFYNDPDTAKSLAHAPIPLVVMLWLSVWLSPGLVWLVGFDGIASEVQHRTLRYFVTRTRRTSHYVGKALGLWASVAVMTLAMHVVLWGVTLRSGEYGLLDTLGWGIRFWLVAIAVSAAWCGVAALVSSFAGSAGNALLFVGVAFFGLFFAGFLLPRTLGREGDDVLVRGLSLLYPNAYDGWLLSPHLERAATGLVACLAFAIAPSVAGSLAFERRDV